MNQAQEAKVKTEEATEDEQRQIAMLEAATNTENTKFQGITIPAGFAPTRIEGESTVDEGLVITDSEGNEFVWIPVEDDYVAKEEEKLNDAVKWEKEEYDEMKKSVKKYKGFYIGRYEAGSTTERKGAQLNGNGTTEMVVKRDQYPYVIIGWGKYNEETEDYSDNMFGKDAFENEDNGKGAVYLCRHMYDEKQVGVKSTLCYKWQWDAMIEFIKKKGVNTDSDSTLWGNYFGTKYEINRKSAKKQLFAAENKYIDGYHSWEPAYGLLDNSSNSYLLTTGASDRNMAKNIYDVAGNCWEYVMGGLSDNGVKNGIRQMLGGSVRDPSSYATLTSGLQESAWYPDASFRPALFVN